MKKILKKANIPYSSNLIHATTDLKSFSGKRLGQIGLGIFFLSGGALSLYGTFWMVSLALNKSMLYMLAAIVFASFTLIGLIATYGFFSASNNWFLILYRDRLLYKYRLTQTSKKRAYRALELPLHTLKGCYILREYREGEKVRRINTSDAVVSVHFQYLEEEKKKYLSIYQLNDYIDISFILSYLEVEKGIPIYFKKAHQTFGEALDSIELLEDAERIAFTHELKNHNVTFFLE